MFGTLASILEEIPVVFSRQFAMVARKLSNVPRLAVSGEILQAT